ncbi:torsin-1A-interacting protein 2-like isoform X2 [Cynoglossus semilaevis]|uniref:torsin-1A-interacting protein 2-like isoform X2 n=1 Tax=Cynoglossus semilaevis TaxID=244447 RepID=UPI0004962B54|nr:torsin-1A-interacting protein 2-like isoform X2 [Cynoglossus semilaevis]XP_024908909.1 torsin-1A-interacting protein 2-like isoform X2 [Cynoglossus semilaevis]
MKSENTEPRALRRSARQASSRVSPNKKSRLETEGAVDRSGDENEMEVQKPTEAVNDKDEEMDTEIKDSTHPTHPNKPFQGPAGDFNVFPHVVLRERCQPQAIIGDADLPKVILERPRTKKPAASTKSAEQVRPPVSRYDIPVTKFSVADYHDKLGSIPRAAVKPSLYQSSEKSSTVHHRLNLIPKHKEPVPRKKELLKKTNIIKTSPGHSYRGFMWYLWCVILLMLMSSAVLLVYMKTLVHQRVTNEERYLTKTPNTEMFAVQFSVLEAQFVSQRDELWRRSKIHLEKHLRTAEPTEPVSLIITAGHKAEKTLQCLAQKMASSFSSALNGSVLQIDGVSKAGQNSDQVKLDIDRQLKEAFEGDKPVAVIHRFEELPSGSTLIFYRYCDHENAAYKQVFLLFTVLLPQDEVSSQLHLNDVEEMVQDYIKDRLVGSSSQSSFNEMDTDKFPGLWSRISHLILPVVSEKEIEQKGC